MGGAGREGGEDHCIAGEQGVSTLEMEEFKRDADRAFLAFLVQATILAVYLLLLPDYSILPWACFILDYYIVFFYLWYADEIKQAAQIESVQKERESAQ